MVKISGKTSSDLAALQDFAATAAEFDRQWWQLVSRHVEAVASEDRVRALDRTVLFALADAGDEGLPGPLLATRVGGDRAYLTRCLADLARRGWISTSADADDARVKWYRLLARGRKGADHMRAAIEIRLVEALAGLDLAALTGIAAALATIRKHLQPSARRPYDLVRGARADDYGWVIERHGALYHREQQYDETFVAFVAEGVARFVRDHDPRREQALIAERAGRRTGSAFVVRESDRVARLRFFLVEPDLRGEGIGRMLLSQVNGFVQSAGYDRIVLWTQAHLHAAIALYKSWGYKLLKEEPHPGFGRPVVAQEWALDLRPSRR